MRRRYKALIAIALPVAIVYGLKYASYEWLIGYTCAYEDVKVTVSPMKRD